MLAQQGRKAHAASIVAQELAEGLLGVREIDLLTLSKARAVSKRLLRCMPVIGTLLMQKLEAQCNAGLTWKGIKNIIEACCTKYAP